MTIRELMEHVGIDPAGCTVNGKPLRRRYAKRMPDGERLALKTDLRARYEAGATIRELAAETDRSYGGVHLLLRTSGVEFRPRGGAR